MRRFLALLMLSGCADVRQSSAPSGGPLEANGAQNLAQSAGSSPEADPCERPAEVVSGPSVADHGAWTFNARRRADGFSFRTMSDTNVYEPGSIYVWMQNSEGRSLSLVVAAHGGDLAGREFEGAEWEAASTGARAAMVKRSIFELAGRVEGTCGARLESLNEEMQSFEEAFAHLNAPLD